METSSNKAFYASKLVGEKTPTRAGHKILDFGF
jgi:hypothetical protein